MKSNENNSSNTESLTLRKIQSFVTRQGRITAGQQNAIDAMQNTHIVNYVPEILDLNQVFASNNPVVIEIGFGMGHATLEIAKSNPDKNYLGIEVHAPGVGSLLMRCRENNVHNVKVIKHDAVEVLTNMISDSSIAGFHIFFPDPWHKKRHHKRRLIQTNFIELLCSKLQPDGYIHIATDWEDYAVHIEEVLKTHKLLKLVPYNQTLRPNTKFERRGVNLGHKIQDFYAIKCP